jgi:hypothetical protein
MKPLNREEIVSILGPVDDLGVAEIIGTGATLAELEEAHAWSTNDEPLINAGRSLPGGRVGQLLEIIRDLDSDAEELAGRSVE